MDTNVQEQRIVRKLIRGMVARGFKLDSVSDGEERTTVVGERDAIDVIFSVDSSWLYFKSDMGKRHYVFLVCGNGEDIISDWSFSRNDVDGFNAAMEGIIQV